MAVTDASALCSTAGGLEVEVVLFVSLVELSSLSSLLPQEPTNPITTIIPIATAMRRICDSFRLAVVRRWSWGRLRRQGTAVSPLPGTERFGIDAVGPGVDTPSRGAAAGLSGRVEEMLMEPTDLRIEVLADPRGPLLRLTGALDTTSADSLVADADRAPGPGQPAPDPRLCGVDILRLGRPAGPEVIGGPRSAGRIDHDRPPSRAH